MNFENVHSLVEQVAQAVSELRVTLENHALPGLEEAAFGGCFKET